MRIGFQSTPPAEARGDDARDGCRVIRRGGTGFNPLPPPKRGETRRGRAPDRGAIGEFQSTPPAEARGDGGYESERFHHSPRRSERVFLSTESFNPLPPPKRGETS